MKPDEPPVVNAALLTKVTSGFALDSEERKAAHHNE